MQHVYRRIKNYNDWFLVVKDMGASPNYMREKRRHPFLIFIVLDVVDVDSIREGYNGDNGGDGGRGGRG